MSPPVYVVILNWNSTEDTFACVAALERQDYPDLRIIVVDNGSEAAAVTPLREAGPRFRLLCNASNLGYAGGCNVGLRHMMAEGGEYLWLLNSDAAVQSDTLRNLVAAAAADPAIGLVSPLLRDTEPPHALAPFCAIFDRSTLTYNYTSQLANARAWQSTYADRIALMGTALLIRRSVIEAIGELDEKLFAYWEDTDYAIRASASGFASRVNYETAVLHPVKHTYRDTRAVSPHYYYYMTRNEILLLRKHGSGSKLVKALRWAFLQQMQVIQRLGNDHVAVQAVLAGLWDGWTDRGGAFDVKRKMPLPLRHMLSRYAGLSRRLSSSH